MILNLKKEIDMKKTLLAAFTVLSMCTATAPVTAQEIPEPYTATMNKGLVCETEESLKTAIRDLREQKGIVEEGCFSLKTKRTTIAVSITPLYWYEHDNHNFLIAEAEAADGVRYIYLKALKLEGEAL